MYKLILTLPFLFLLACGSGDGASAEAEAEEKTNSSQVLMDESMALHDEVMPMMGSLETLGSNLKNQKGKLVEAQIATEEEVDQLIGRLSNANESMMSWMNNYNTEVVRKEEPATIEVLEKLKKGITQVKKDMMESQAAAEAMLSSAKE